MYTIKNTVVAVLLFANILFASTLRAELSTDNRCEPWVAKAVSIQGIAEQRVVTDDQESWHAVQAGHIFCAKDVLRVRENSRAALVLTNDTIVRLDENTTITFSNLSPDSASSLDLDSGIAHFISRVKQLFKIITPFVNASIEGTEFVVTVEPEQAQVTVFEGVVKAENEQGHVILKQGQTAIALKDQAPVLKTLVKPRDAVQWALYYPTIIEGVELSAITDEELRSRLEQSLSLNANGDISGALSIIDDLPESLSHAGVWVYRASLALGVGRINKANDDIARVLAFDYIDSNVSSHIKSQALALQSIIAVVQNQVNDAQTFAQQAIDTDTKNPSAYLAMSYAKQAQFDLPGAQAVMQQSTLNALVHSRRAELALMQGEFDNALTQAAQATQLNPNLSHTQTVLGYAHLLQIELNNAKAAFNKAITLDQANPLAHMGLGLTIIREGDLENGRREIEYAASLDPNNALIRSYLGKAYYEENRNHIAADQFDMAKALDPNDPTPWFYDAIRKQSENNPVGALEDIQKSIELNDNRAVYRSRFLLDQDLAVRTTTQANLYNELGLDHLAILEASNSITAYPDNFSAHRFLSESYAGKQRLESASASELLQAQLLQPKSLGIIKPHAAEINLNTVTPTALAYNEYSSLFENDEFKMNTAFFAGNNSLLSDELILSGHMGKTSYSLGQYYYETDGFRKDADVKHEIYNTIIQHPIANNLDIQFEYRTRDTKQGDLAQDFSENQTPSENRTLNQDTLRIGGRYNFSPNSILIFSAMDVDKQVITTISDDEFGLTITNIDDIGGTDYQIRYLLDTQLFNLAFGLGLYDISAHTIEQLDFDGLLLDPNISDNQIEQKTLYIYINHFPTHTLTASYGFSYDTMDNSYLKRDFSEIFPKFGITWNLTEETTIRLVTLKTFKRLQPTNQTLEQTQIAGFNQFYDDFNATEAEMFGVGIDNQFSSQSKIGMSFIRRDTIIPRPPGGIRTEITRDETIYKFYFYTSLENLSLSTELNYENYENDVINPLKIKTYILPINLNYTLTNNISGNVTVKHIEQYVDFDPNYPLATSGEEKTNIVNLALSYKITPYSGKFSFNLHNAFNKKFKYQDNTSISSDPFTAETQILPTRTFIARFIYTFN